jgi:hypothetical protein
MSKFNKLVNNIYSNILLEADAAPAPAAMPQDGGATAPAPAEAPAAPAPAEAPPLSSEGKKFLVELALKALSVSPDELSESDKSIFETQVTTQNADQIAERIRNLVEGL